MSEPIEILVYDAEWPRLFEALGSDLRTGLGPVALRIDHIGSTAIVGLAAKPIIDVQISVASLEPVSPFADPLTELGFVLRTDNPDRTKRYFREAPGTRRTHIHVRRAGSWSEQFALLFRDYLRVERDDRELYERTKRALASEFRNDRERYVQSKGAVIHDIMTRANAWSQEAGWSPGPSDV